MTTNDKKIVTIRNKSASAEPMPAQTRSERRQNMIYKSADQALAQGDAFEANLESTATDLMQFSWWVREDIESARLDIANPLERAEITLLALEQLNQLNKRLQAYAELKMRMKQARTEAKLTNPKPVLRLPLKEAK